MTPEDQLGSNRLISLDEYEEILAKKFNVPLHLVKAVRGLESSDSHLDEKGGVKTSWKGARGRFQLDPNTARGMGINPDDEFENTYGGIKYLSEGYQEAQKYQDVPDDKKWAGALVYYHGGPNGLKRAASTGTFANDKNAKGQGLYSNEYATRILNNANRIRDEELQAQGLGEAGDPYGTATPVSQTVPASTPLPPGVGEYGPAVLPPGVGEYGPVDTLPPRPPAPPKRKFIPDLYGGRYEDEGPWQPPAQGKLAGVKPAAPQGYQPPPPSAVPPPAPPPPRPTGLAAYGPQQAEAPWITYERQEQVKRQAEEAIRNETLRKLQQAQTPDERQRLIENEQAAMGQGPARLWHNVKQGWKIAESRAIELQKKLPQFGPSEHVAQRAAAMQARQDHLEADVALTSEADPSLSGDIFRSAGQVAGDMMVMAPIVAGTVATGGALGVGAGIAGAIGTMGGTAALQNWQKDPWTAAVETALAPLSFGAGGLVRKLGGAALGKIANPMLRGMARTGAGAAAGAAVGAGEEIIQETGTGISQVLQGDANWEQVRHNMLVAGLTGGMFGGAGSVLTGAGKVGTTATGGAVRSTGMKLPPGVTLPPGTPIPPTALSSMVGPVDTSIVSGADMRVGPDGRSIVFHAPPSSEAPEISPEGTTVVPDQLGGRTFYGGAGENALADREQQIRSQIDLLQNQIVELAATEGHGPKTTDLTRQRNQLQDQLNRITQQGPPAPQTPDDSGVIDVPYIPLPDRPAPPAPFWATPGMLPTGAVPPVEPPAVTPPVTPVTPSGTGPQFIRTPEQARAAAGEGVQPATEVEGIEPETIDTVSRKHTITDTEPRVKTKGGIGGSLAVRMGHDLPWYNEVSHSVMLDPDFRQALARNLNDLQEQGITPIDKNDNPIDIGEFSERVPWHLRGKDRTLAVEGQRMKGSWEGIEKAKDAFRFVMQTRLGRGMGQQITGLSELSPSDYIDFFNENIPRQSKAWQKLRNVFDAEGLQWPEHAKTTGERPGGRAALEGIPPHLDITQELDDSLADRKPRSLEGTAIQKAVGTDPHVAELFAGAYGRVAQLEAARVAKAQASNKGGKGKSTGVNLGVITRLPLITQAAEAVRSHTLRQRIKEKVAVKPADMVKEQRERKAAGTAPVAKVVASATVLAQEKAKKPKEPTTVIGKMKAAAAKAKQEREGTTPGISVATPTNVVGAPEGPGLFENIYTDIVQLQQQNAKDAAEVTRLEGLQAGGKDTALLRRQLNATKKRIKKADEHIANVAGLLSPEQQEELGVTPKEKGKPGRKPKAETEKKAEPTPKKKTEKQKQKDRILESVKKQKEKPKAKAKKEPAVEPEGTSPLGKQIREHKAKREAEQKGIQFTPDEELTTREAIGDEQDRLDAAQNDAQGAEFNRIQTRLEQLAALDVQMEEAARTTKRPPEVTPIPKPKAKKGKAVKLDPEEETDVNVLEQDKADIEEQLEILEEKESERDLTEKQQEKKEDLEDRLQRIEDRMQELEDEAEQAELDAEEEAGEEDADTVKVGMILQTEEEAEAEEAKKKGKTKPSVTVAEPTPEQDVDYTSGVWNSEGSPEKLDVLPEVEAKQAEIRQKQGVSARARKQLERTNLTPKQRETHEATRRKAMADIKQLQEDIKALQLKATKSRRKGAATEQEEAAARREEIDARRKAEAAKNEELRKTADADARAERELADQNKVLATQIRVKMEGRRTDKPETAKEKRVRERIEKAERLAKEADEHIGMGMDLLKDILPKKGERGGGLGAPPINIPATLKAIRHFGHGYILKGLRGFMGWQDAVLSHFGNLKDTVRPYLQQVYAELRDKDFAKDKEGFTAEEEVESIANPSPMQRIREFATISGIRRKLGTVTDDDRDIFEENEALSKEVIEKQRATQESRVRAQLEAIALEERDKKVKSGHFGTHKTISGIYSLPAPREVSDADVTAEITRREKEEEKEARGRRVVTAKYPPFEPITNALERDLEILLRNGQISYHEMRTAYLELPYNIGLTPEQLEELSVPPADLAELNQARQSFTIATEEAESESRGRAYKDDTKEAKEAREKSKKQSLTPYAPAPVGTQVADVVKHRAVLAAYLENRGIAEKKGIPTSEVGKGLGLPDVRPKRPVFGLPEVPAVAASELPQKQRIKLNLAVEQLHGLRARAAVLTRRLGKIPEPGAEFFQAREAPEDIEAIRTESNFRKKTEDELAKIERDITIQEGEVHRLGLKEPGKDVKEVSEKAKKKETHAEQQQRLRAGGEKKTRGRKSKARLAEIEAEKGYATLDDAVDTDLADVADAEVVEELKGAASDIRSNALLGTGHQRRTGAAEEEAELMARTAKDRANRVRILDEALGKHVANADLQRAVVADMEAQGAGSEAELAKARRKLLIIEAMANETRKRKEQFTDTGPSFIRNAASQEAAGKTVRQLFPRTQWKTDIAPGQASNLAQVRAEFGRIAPLGDLGIEAVEGNEAMTQLMGTALTDLGFGGQWDAVVLPRDFLGSISAQLRDYGPKAIALSDHLRSIAKSPMYGEHVVFFNTGRHVSNDRVYNAALHEFGHQFLTDVSGGKLSPWDGTYITGDAAYEHLRAGVAAMEANPDISDADVEKEAPAYILSNQWKAMGFKSFTDARAFLKRYVKQLAKDFGAEGLDRWPLTKVAGAADTLTEIVKEVQGEIQRKAARTKSGSKNATSGTSPPSTRGSTTVLPGGGTTVPGGRGTWPGPGGGPVVRTTPATGGGTTGVAAPAPAPAPAPAAPVGGGAGIPIGAGGRGGRVAGAAPIPAGHPAVLPVIAAAMPPVPAPGTPAAGILAKLGNMLRARMPAPSAAPAGGGPGQGSGAGTKGSQVGRAANVIQQTNMLVTIPFMAANWGTVIGTTGYESLIASPAAAVLDAIISMGDVSKRTYTRRKFTDYGQGKVIHKQLQAAAPPDSRLTDITYRDPAFIGPMPGLPPGVGLPSYLMGVYEPIPPALFTNKILGNVTEKALYAVNVYPDTVGYIMHAYANSKANVSLMEEQAAAAGRTLVKDDYDAALNAAKMEAQYQALRQTAYPSRILKTMKEMVTGGGLAVLGHKTPLIRARKVAFGLGDLIGNVKFTQVPGAMMHHAINKSPLGWIRAAGHGLQAHAAKAAGQDTEAKYHKQRAIKAFTEASTSTIGLMGVGAMMGFLGMTVQSPKDYEEEETLMSMGKIPFGVNWSRFWNWVASGFDSRALEWQDGDDISRVTQFIAPLGISLEIGSEIGHAMRQVMREGKKLGVLDSLSLALGPIKEAFDSLSELTFGERAWSDIRKIVKESEGWGEIFKGVANQVALNAVTQGTSSQIFNQLAQAIDPVRREYRHSKEKGSTAGWIEEFVRRPQARIPGLSKNLPARLTAWGETMEHSPNATLLQRLLPGKHTQYKKDALKEATVELEKSPHYLRPKEGETYENMRSRLEARGARLQGFGGQLIMSHVWQGAAPEEQKYLLQELYERAADPKAKLNIAAFAESLKAHRKYKRTHF